MSETRLPLVVIRRYASARFTISTRPEDVCKLPRNLEATMKEMGTWAWERQHEQFVWQHAVRIARRFNFSRLNGQSLLERWTWSVTGLHLIESELHLRACVGTRGPREHQYLKPWFEFLRASYKILPFLLGTYTAVIQQSVRRLNKSEVNREFGLLKLALETWREREAERRLRNLQRIGLNVTRRSNWPEHPAGNIGWLCAINEAILQRLKEVAGQSAAESWSAMLDGGFADLANKIKKKLRVELRNCYRCAPATMLEVEDHEIIRFAQPPSSQDTRVQVEDTRVQVRALFELLDYPVAVNAALNEGLFHFHYGTTRCWGALGYIAGTSVPFCVLLRLMGALVEATQRELDEAQKSMTVWPALRKCVRGSLQLNTRSAHRELAKLRKLTEFRRSASQ